jgi:hypothetical protein
MLPQSLAAPFQMPLIERPNRDALRRALDIYHDAMRSFVVRTLVKVHGRQRAQDLIIDTLRHTASSRFRRELRYGNVPLEQAIDIGDIPNIVDRYWDCSFGRELPAHRVRPDFVGMTRLIWNMRNRVEHWSSRDDLDTEEARARLTDIATVLGLINALVEQREVEQIRSQLAAASSSSAVAGEQPAIASTPRNPVPSPVPPAQRTSQAQQIRDYLRQRVDVRRQAGATSVTFRAGDVHDDLGLRSRLPNVCQVLEGNLFHAQAGVERVRCLEQPPSGRGANLVIEFRILPTTGPSR